MNQYQSSETLYTAGYSLWPDPWEWAEEAYRGTKLETAKLKWFNYMGRSPGNSKTYSAVIEVDQGKGNLFITDDGGRIEINGRVNGARINGPIEAMVRREFEKFKAQERANHSKPSA